MDKLTVVSLSILITAQLEAYLLVCSAPDSPRKLNNIKMKKIMERLLMCLEVERQC